MIQSLSYDFILIAILDGGDVTFHVSTLPISLLPCRCRIAKVVALVAQSHEIRRADVALLRRFLIVMISHAFVRRGACKNTD